MAKVAVVGSGYWGANLVRSFAELGALSGVCDIDGDRARELARQYGAVRAYASASELWEGGEIDAVAIAVPAELHYEVAAAALQAGKHCFVEKPLTLRLDHAFHLRHLAAERQRILMVGHLLEYHPAVCKLKELIDAGALGSIRYLYSTRLNMGKVRQEENALWSLGVHDISMILRLLGEEPSAVSAFGGSYLTPGVQQRPDEAKGLGSVA